MNKRLGTLFLVVCLAWGLAAAPVEAGILDSIKGFFGKASDTVKGWFSGGGTKEFEEMLQKVQTSQETVAEKQNDVYTFMGHRQTTADDADFQKYMNALADANRENEQLYLQLLKVRQELVDNKKDVSKYADALSRLQQTQHNLEEGNQAIQDRARQMGAFTPPAEVAATKSAAAAGALWKDPRAQGFIDEWLAANGLNQYGIQVGGVVVMSATPDFDGPRHQWVWENLAGVAGRVTGMTLEQYVRSRLDGGAAAPPSGGMETASASGGEIERGSTTSTVGSTPYSPSTYQTDGSLEGTEEQLKAAMKAYEELSTKGQGNSEEAVQLLETVKALKTQRDELIRQKSAATGSN